MAAQITDEETVVVGRGPENLPTKQRPDLHDVFPAAAQGRPEEGGDHGVGRLGHVEPDGAAHEPGVPLQRPGESIEVVGHQEMLMIHAHQRDPHPARGPGERGLEVDDRQFGPEGVELAEHAVDERPELAGLIVEPRGDRPHDVEPTGRVLKHDPRNPGDADPRMVGREAACEELEGVVRRVDQEVVVALEVLDERGDAGGVSAPLSAQADGDLRHGVMAGDRSGRRLL